MHPHIYRTKNGGRTWKEIVNGLPDDPINVVREDPLRKGLLFAGSERTVYVSFDDGEHWQSLRLNMPATSIRDLVIKDDDLVIGTHGRGFWILDNITPLRQLQASIRTAQVMLFRPQTALRVRWNMNTDTPLPPDVAAGENPPDGAMIDYYLGSSTKGEVTVEIKDEKGNVVRRYSSADPIPAPDPMLAIPPYWLRPPQKLAGEPGLHRFLWDLHYTPVPGVQPQYPIAAVYRNTAPAATSPWAMPGKYTITLMAGGKKYTQSLVLKMDPRVKASNADLGEQFKLSRQLYDEWMTLGALGESVRQVRGQLTELRPRVPEGDLKKHVDELSEKLQALAGGAGPGAAAAAGASARPTIASVTGRLRTLFNLIEDVDVAPTPQVAAAVPIVSGESRTVQESWQGITAQDIPALNRELRAAGLPEITMVK